MTARYDTHVSRRYPELRSAQVGETCGQRQEARRRGPWMYLEPELEQAVIRSSPFAGRSSLWTAEDVWGAGVWVEGLDW